MAPKIIVSEDRPAGKAIAAAALALAHAGKPAIGIPIPARRAPYTPSGYRLGQKLKSGRDDRVYQVAPDGSFRRLTPKPPSKKERRAMKRLQAAIDPPGTHIESTCGVDADAWSKKGS